MKIFITGANGFIGSNLSRYLLGKGYEVYGLVRKTSDLHFLNGLDIKLIFGNLLSPEDIAIPRDVDHIVHSASVVSDTACDEVCRNNIFRLAENLVWRIYDLRIPVRRLVFISTALTLGFNGINISEENPGEPADVLAYTRFKKKTEQYFMELWRTNRFPVVILRPADVYGPNDRITCSKLLRGCERGIPLIVGKGDCPFSFCYINNLCLATHLALMTPGVEGKAYTVTNGTSPTWRSFFKGLQDGLHKKQRLYIPVSLAFAVAGVMQAVKKIFPGYDPPITYYRIKRITTPTTYDISKTVAELGYKPDDDFEKQIRAIVSWYLKERKDGFIE